MPHARVMVGAVKVEQHPVSRREAMAAPLEGLHHPSAYGREQRIEAPDLLDEGFEIRVTEPWRVSPGDLHVVERSALKATNRSTATVRCNMLMSSTAAMGTRSIAPDGSRWSAMICAALPARGLAADTGWR